MKKGIPLRPGAQIHLGNPGPQRNHAPKEPVRRSQPLLMKHWKHLWRREFIELRQGGHVKGRGWIDDLTPDGTIVWIYRTGGLGRMMIHKDDGVDIWRVDPRILQNRHDPRTGKAC